MQPLFYAALAAAAGIAAAALGPAWLGPLGWAPVWMGLGLAWLALLPRRRWAAALGLCLCLSGGYARARHSLPAPDPQPVLLRQSETLAPRPRDRAFVTGFLRDTPEALYDHARISAVRIDMEAVSIAARPDAATAPTAGGIRLYAYPPQPETAVWARPLLALEAGAGLGITAHLRPPSVYLDPGVPDFAAASRRQGIVATATLPLDGWQPWPALQATAMIRWRARAWRGLSRGLDDLAPPANAGRVNGLLRGMLLGDTARLDETTRTNFQVDGIYHLLVVAGLHIGVLAAFLVWTLRRLRVAPVWARGLALAALGGYCWIIAARTPTERALLMLTAYFAAQLWYRERQALNAVGVAALLLLAWHPLDLFTAGWQMSLGAATLLAGVALPWLARGARPCRDATLGFADAGRDAACEPGWAQWRLNLRELAGRLGAIWHPLGWRVLPLAIRAGVRVYEAAVIALVLQLGFAGFNAVYFHRANPWSVPANALLVPAASLLLPLAWLGLLAQGCGHVLAHLAAVVVTRGGADLLAAADGLARWPLAQWRVPSPPGWFLLLLAATVAVWLWLWRVKCSPHLATAALWLLAVVMAICPFRPRLPPGLTMTALDVGEGDAIVVTFPDRRTLLVDGGPRSPHWDSGEEIVAPYLWSLGLRHIDAMLLTHGHNDHIGGLPFVLANFHPDEVWMTRSLPPDAAVQAFLRQVETSGARLRRCVAGDVYLAGTSRLEVLLPAPQYTAGATASNNDSMALRVSWQGEAMMLTGDAQSPAERWLTEQGLDLASPLLKVGHHGSNTSSTRPFLAAMQPRVAVISDGRANAYGFPTAPALARLEAAGAQVFRTDRDGAIQSRLLPGRIEVYLFHRLPGGAGVSGDRGGG